MPSRGFPPRPARTAPSASWLAATVAHTRVSAHQGAVSANGARNVATARPMTVHGAARTATATVARTNLRATSGVGEAAVMAAATSSSTVDSATVVATARSERSKAVSNRLPTAHAAPSNTVVTRSVQGCSRSSLRTSRKRRGSRRG